MNLENAIYSGSGVSKVVLLAFLASVGCSGIQRPNQYQAQNSDVSLNLPDEGVDLLRKAMKGGCGFLEYEGSELTKYIEGLINNGRFEEARAMEEAVFALGGDTSWLSQRPNERGYLEGYLCEGVRAAVACKLGAACGENCDVTEDSASRPQARYDGAEPQTGLDYVTEMLRNGKVDEKRVANKVTNGAYVEGIPWYMYGSGIYWDGSSNNLLDGSRVAADKEMFVERVVSGLDKTGGNVESHLEMRNLNARAIADRNLTCWRRSASSLELESYVHDTVKRVLRGHLKGVAKDKRSVVGSQYKGRVR